MEASQFFLETYLIFCAVTGVLGTVDLQASVGKLLRLVGYQKADTETLPFPFFLQPSSCTSYKRKPVCCSAEGNMLSPHPALFSWAFA